MRWFRSFVSVILLLFGMTFLAIPTPAAAQEEQGHILLSLRICSTPSSAVAWSGTFSDTSACEGFVGGDRSTPMVITLDGGQFIESGVPIGSTITLPFASMLDASLYLTPGDYTLTITFQSPISASDLVSTATSVHIVAGRTLPLTFTALYALEFGVEPAPTPGTPEAPIDQTEGPITATEVPSESLPQAAEGSSGIGTNSKSADELNSASITTLPRTGAGPSSNRGSLAFASTMIAAFAFIASAAAIHIRRYENGSYDKSLPSNNPER